MTEIQNKIVVSLTTILILLTVAGASDKKTASFPQAAFLADTIRMGGNNIDLAMENDGATGLDGISYYPNGTDLAFLFSGGVALSGFVENELRVSWIFKSSIIDEWQPGSWGMSPDDPLAKFFAVSPFDTSGGDAYRSWADAVEMGAEFLDVNGNNFYEPDIDQPLILGEKTIWCAFNDNTSLQQRTPRFETLPLGLEIQQTSWAYNTHLLANAIFFRHKIINRTQTDIDDLIFSQVMDPDIGGYQDDLIGCDTTLGLGYCYNDGDDPEYGMNPPAFGILLLQGSSVASPGDTAYRFHCLESRFDTIPGMRNLPMTAFNPYLPSYIIEENAWTARIRQEGGLDLEGNPILPPQWGIGGTPSDNPKFMFSGDPAAGTGWLCNTPSDIRFLVNSGPFRLAAGDTQDVIFAYVLGRGADALGSVTALRENARIVLTAFQKGLKLAQPPSAPEVSVRTFDRRVELLIDLRDLIAYRKTDAVGNRQVFEGLTIYQLQTASPDLMINGEENAKAIARFDLENKFGDLYHVEDDGRLGLVWHGQNNFDTTRFRDPRGAYLQFTVETDAFNDNEPLLNQQEYYFAVVPFSFNHASAFPNVITQTVDDDWILPNPSDYLPASKFPVLKATPGSAEFFPFAGEQADHAEGQSQGQVRIELIDRETVSGDSYRVNFYDNAKYWQLRNLSQDRVVLDSLMFQGITGDEWNFPVIDGVMVRVMDVEDKLAGIDSSGSMWLEPNPASTFGPEAIFNRSISLLKSEFPNLSSIRKNEYFPVKIEFNPPDSSLGFSYYGRMENLTLRPTRTHAIAVKAYDISQAESPRQVNVAYYAPGNPIKGDLIFDGSCRVMIMTSDYDTLHDYSIHAEEDSLFKSEAYIILNLISKSVIPGEEGNFSMIITPHYPNSDSDIFDFSTTSLKQGITSDQRKNLLGRINVVPNPYFGYSEYESRFNGRVVKFIHLDKVATIRIFDLAGRLVRTLNKNGTSSNEIAWDLLNRSGKRIGSGMYIAHIEVPGVGEKVIKFAVILTH